MVNVVKRFWRGEDGAVTVDFVVLTGAIVVLGLLVGTAISEGGATLAENKGNHWPTVHLVRISIIDRSSLKCAADPKSVKFVVV